MLGACGQALKPGGSDLLSTQRAAQQAAQGSGQQAHAGSVRRRCDDDLQKATDYWGKAYAENPRDLQTALNYARNLKAMGEKRRALGGAAAGRASSTVTTASSPANTAASPSTSTR